MESAAHREMIPMPFAVLVFSEAAIGKRALSRNKAPTRHKALVFPR
jgi:hypothetical protein